MTTTHLKIFQLIVMSLLLVVHTAQADDDLADDVISSEFQVVAYNPRNDTDEELSKAVVINSDLRLRHLLLHDAANSEIKICFGLHLLRRRIEEARQGEEADKLRLPLLLKQQAELVKVFRALHEPNGVEKNHVRAAESDVEAKKMRLWEGGRITPEQPFPARVVGVTSSWVGYALLLEEIKDEKPRYCIALLFATSKLDYKIVPDKAAFADFNGVGASGKWATYLSPGVNVDNFSWGIGIDTIGRRFGEKDCVRKWYPNWIKATKLAQ